MSEGALATGLTRAGLKFENVPGEGAFYGPKIEFHIQDALKRSWQLATLQYDPNLPERFELDYVGDDGKEHRPVMLHRAIFGSLERFISVYIEHCAGNFPAWIAPMQAVVLTVSDKTEEYGRDVLARLKAKGFRVEADFSGDKLGAKIRNARAMRHPYMLIVGPKDAEGGTVSVRSATRASWARCRSSARCWRTRASSRRSASAADGVEIGACQRRFCPSPSGARPWKAPAEDAHDRPSGSCSS